MPILISSNFPNNLINSDFLILQSFWTAASETQPFAFCRSKGALPLPLRMRQYHNTNFTKKSPSHISGTVKNMLQNVMYFTNISAKHSAQRV